MYSFVRLLISLIALSILFIYFYQIPAYVTVLYYNTSIEVPLWAAILVMLMSFCVLNMLLSLVKIVFNLKNNFFSWYNKHSHNKAKYKLNQGLLEFFSGNWLAAEKILCSMGKIDEIDKELLEIITAKAAIYGGRFKEHAIADKKIINLLHNNLSHDHYALPYSLITIEQLMHHGYWSKAVDLLEPLRKQYHTNVYLVQLLKKCYLQLNDWDNLRELLTIIEKQQMISQDEYISLLKIVYINALATIKDKFSVDKLEVIWSGLDKSMHSQNELIVAYVKALYRVGLYARSMHWAVAGLKLNPSLNLLELYATTPTNEVTEQLEQVLFWLDKVEYKALPKYYLLALAGRCYRQLKQHANALDHLVQSFKLQENYIAAEELALLYVEDESYDLSITYFKLAYNLKALNQLKIDDTM